jgi:hypothetical protein
VVPVDWQATVMLGHVVAFYFLLSGIIYALETGGAGTHGPLAYWLQPPEEDMDDLLGGGHETKNNNRRGRAGNSHRDDERRSLLGGGNGGGPRRRQRSTRGSATNAASSGGGGIRTRQNSMSGVGVAGGLLSGRTGGQAAQSMMIVAWITLGNCVAYMTPHSLAS